MSRRIETLSESPCYKCGRSAECMEKIRRSPILMEICDAILGNADFDYHDCSLWIAMSANTEESDG